MTHYPFEDTKPMIRRPLPTLNPRPHLSNSMILTLCGSAKYEPLWHEVNKQLGLAGHLCFTLMTWPSVEGAKTWYTDEEKTLLDLMHLAKIDASDGAVMLNVDDYLGESSSRELAWARYKNKAIFWLEEPILGRRKHERLLTELVTLNQAAMILAVHKSLQH